MKPPPASLAFFHRKPPCLNFSPPSSPIIRFATCTTTTTTTDEQTLTEEEVKQINDVVPRLCSSHHLKDAVNLISAALSTANPPPLASFPLPILIKTLASEPDLTLPMHLLNSLKFNSNAEKTLILLPIAKMFVSNFFQTGQPKRAVKIFQWMSRPDFRGAAKDLGFYAVLVDGFCRHGLILEALRVVRVMASEDLVIGGEIRVWVYRGLLKEARVKDALELDAALERCTLGSGSGTSGSKEVVDLLDRIIADWVE